MNRPQISVVMPFAGTPDAARGAFEALRMLDAGPEDELILIDNTPDLAAASLPASGSDAGPEVRVITASGEASPAHARNVGAENAKHDWILFLDADALPRPGLLAAFWDGGIPEEVGALAGEIVPGASSATLAGRYGSARSFLGQQAHYEHPYRPRAAAANLLVRRAAFEQLGGFFEGVRAAEDTDFTWRLQEAGWRLWLRPEAQVEHRYRASLPELRRQWRGYAAGRAWLARRYAGFVPEPALRRGIRRGGRLLATAVRHKRARTDDAAIARTSSEPESTPRAERARFFALDALLSLEELAGFGLSNRPGSSTPTRSPAAVVLVADRFPARDDPLVELVDRLERARVEAVGRPVAADLAAARRLAIDYQEDDGQVARVSAAVLLCLRHPGRVLSDVIRRGPEEPPLRILAPAVRRLKRDHAVRLHPLGGGRSRATAERLARLARRPLD